VLLDHPIRGRSDATATTLHGYDPRAMTEQRDPAADPPSDPAPARHRHRRAAAILGLVLLVVAVVAGATGGLLAWDAGYEGRILPGVHVGTVDLSGLDRDQAAAALNAAYPLDEGSLVLSTPDGEIAIPYSEVGRRLDTEALVDEAMVSGRKGELLDRAVAEIRQALDGTVIVPRALLDRAAVEQAVTARLRTLDRAPVDATVTMGPDAPVMTSARAGRTVDAAPVAQSAIAALAPLDAPAEVVLQTTPMAIAPGVDDAVVEEAMRRANQMIADVRVRYKDKQWRIKAAIVRSWIRFETNAYGLVTPVVDTSDIAARLKKPTKAVLKKPTSAQYLRTRTGKVFGVVASSTGRKLDVERTVARIATELTARSYGTPPAAVAVATRRTQPKLATEEARKVAPVMTLLGSWTTYFPISDRNYYGANIWRPAEIINGTVLRPGQSFDWWNAIWPVTTARGFGPGGIIRSDHTDPTGALGGGMCSSSTTLFNAAMRAGLAMHARSNHKYYINRYPLGLDATVSVIGNSRQTMSFTNDTKHAILIRGVRIRNGSSGYVRYEIWGLPDGRTVSIGRPVVTNVQKATTNIVYVDNLAHGVRVQTEYPSNGMDVSVTRIVRNAAGRVIHVDTWRSHYVLWNGRIEVGR
jgi:vancomycin resistance protein YoaR